MTAPAKTPLPISNRKANVSIFAYSDPHDVMVSLIEDCIKKNNLNKNYIFKISEDINDVLESKADIYFIDFGVLMSMINYGGGHCLSWEIMQLVKFIRLNKSSLFYFCLTMPEDFYDEYEDDFWKRKNVIKVAHHEWGFHYGTRGDAINKILSGIYVKEEIK
jgi:hypothetical protein